MPYTHSLLAVIIWSILGGIWYRYVSGYRGGNAAAPVIPDTSRKSETESEMTSTAESARFRKTTEKWRM